MSELPKPNNLDAKVGPKVDLKLKARKSSQTVWSGLGMMGMVGWSVVIPTLLGAGLGLWLDSLFPGVHTLTLTLLVAGLMLGCLNAWHWVAKEDRAMHADPDDKDE